MLRSVIRLISGNLDIHNQLEREIASLKNTEAAITFLAGYMANVGIISSLFNKDDIVFLDRLNHASIIDGVLLSRAKIKRYPHLDMGALKKMLESSGSYKKRAIITDSVFSMDGDIAPLDKIVELAKKYDCMVMVDEAHALGVLGKNGKGVVEHFGLEGSVDIQMGTLSKAVGSFGAYCCGSTELVDYLINKARSFIYTTGMPSNIAAASLAGLVKIETDQSLRDSLWNNTRFVSRELQRMGFNIFQSQTPIIPVLVKDSKIAVEFSRRLFESGVFVSAIRPPTVPKDTARLRVTIMANHKKQDLEFLLQHMERIGRELCII